MAPQTSSTEGVPAASDERPGAPLPKLLSVGPRRRPARVLIVVAHPDDETIGAAGVLPALAGTCRILHVTEGAPRDPSFVPEGAPERPEEYARLRHHELATALRLAGVDPRRARSLGSDDQEASACLVGLACALEDLLRQSAPEVILTHAYEGGHPDHDATAFVVHAAVARVRRRSPALAPAVVELTSYHGILRDGALRLVTGSFLPHPGAGREEVRPLTASERALKQRMLGCFRTQREVLAPLTADLLEPTCEERFRGAPAYDFTRSPTEGPLWYEELGWPMSGDRWRALARQAARTLGLEDGPWR